VLCTFWAPEVQAPPAAPHTLTEAVVEPLKEFLTRREGWLVLGFILVFKLPDALVESIKTPFLQQPEAMGFSKELIGGIAQGFGTAMSIAGALAGGIVVTKLRLWRSLWLFAALQGLSNLGFWLLWLAGPSVGMLTAVVAVENFCIGLVTAGFSAFLMGQCDRRFSATQYALLTSLMAGGAALFGACSGYAQAALGWSGFFLLSVLAAIPGMALLLWVRPREAEPETSTTEALAMAEAGA
jgi:PAT family beta-lactamase induction signal transducer AmpG